MCQSQLAVNHHIGILQWEQDFRSVNFDLNLIILKFLEILQEMLHKLYCEYALELAEAVVILVKYSESDISVQ